MTLLVMGGSQGASGINQAMIKSLPFLRNTPLQVIHLSGTRDERSWQTIIAGKIFRPTSLPFIIEWKKLTALRISLIARAGAASLAEFAAFHCPAS